MTLEDLFDQLTDGELQQFSLGGNIGEQIAKENRKTMARHINLGLTELYKRFRLKVDSVIIQQYLQITTYYLNRKYAQSNTTSTETYKYILDTVEKPYSNECLKIETVFNEYGLELPINNSLQEYSLFTPTFNALQVTNPESNKALAITYRANHPKISIDDDTNLSEVELELPEYLTEALLLYIGARVAKNTPGLAENGLNTLAQVYKAEFEASCAKITEVGLLHQSDIGNQRFDLRGWI